jgi:AbrB family looped-hinge helix DNA binding protein
MTETHRIRMAANGRLVLPKPVRAALGLKAEGDFLLVSVSKGDIRLNSMAQRIAAVQETYKANVVREISSDEFLAMRREDALSERKFEENA